MLCRMCLLENSNIINIFDETGTKLKISSVITRHFWFEPKNDDPISTIICNSCWLKISDFHEYYTSVEEAQQNLSNLHLISTVKEENNDNNIEENQLIDRDDNGEPGYTHEDPFYNDNNDSNPTIGEPKVLSTVNENNDIIVVDNKFKIENEFSLECALTEENEEKSLKEEAINIDIKEKILENLEINETEDYETEKEESLLRTRKLRVRKSVRSSVKRKLKKVIIINENEDDSEVQIKRKRTSLREKKKSKCKNEKGNSEYVLKSKERDEEIARYMKLKCESCLEEFETFAKLGQHCRDIHNQNPYVICCNKKLYRKNLILDHINRHLNPEYFKCDDCNKSFASKESLKIHMLIRHKSNEERPFECPDCFKRFVKRFQLNHHMKLHKNSIDKREHICDQCGKDFHNRNGLLAHKKYIHEDAYSQMCEICAKVIRNKTLFNKHMQEHLGVVEQEVQCDLCGAKLKNHNSLRKHKRRHEETKAEQMCPMCGKISPTKGALLSHIRYVHSARRVHKCSICNKGFKKPVGLREHMTTHTGEVLYSCPHCPKTFNSSANMHSHRKKAHRKEWEEARQRRGLLCGDTNVEQQNLSNESIIEENKEHTENIVNLNLKMC